MRGWGRIVGEVGEMGGIVGEGCELIRYIKL